MKHIKAVAEKDRAERTLMFADGLTRQQRIELIQDLWRACLISGEASLDSSQSHHSEETEATGQLVSLPIAVGQR